MYRPPLRGSPAPADKKVLLIDRFQATREARAAVLRSHAVEVHEAEEISAARFLWQPQVYDLVMFDVRVFRKNARFYGEIGCGPGSKVFPHRAPKYLSHTGGEVSDNTSTGQWEDSKAFVALLDGSAAKENQVD
jgi:hypothetical protein